MRIILAVAVLLLLVAGGAVLVARSDVLCPEHVTTYAQLPFPAPPLTGDTRLAVGQEVATFGAPAFTGDRSAVTVRTVVVPTVERCDRIVDGYRFFVLKAVHPGELTVTVREQSLTLAIVAG